VGSSLSNTEFNFLCVKEDDIGDKWLKHWDRVWPHCKKWYLSQGLIRRPGYSSCVDALEVFMPEIVPVYNKLNKIVGGGDIECRFLSLYGPPAYAVGCSQAVWDRDDLFLIKNYDYGVSLFENTLFNSSWIRPVIGVLDCAWGLLDGINASGLVASLTFGGRKDLGEGFGAPLIVRYILETCDTVAEAKAKIKNIPCHMAYNITLLDSAGDFTKVFLCPGKKALFRNDPVSTNHQDKIDWIEYAKFSNTVQRYHFLSTKILDPNCMKEDLVQSFFSKPLYSTDYNNHFGTIYTAKYSPKEFKVDLLWQDVGSSQTFKNFTETETFIKLEIENEKEY
jgi:predicted choloylglycine hydrolase